MILYKFWHMFNCLNIFACILNLYFVLSTGKEGFANGLLESGQMMQNYILMA